MFGRGKLAEITKDPPLQARRARYLRPRLDFMMISGQRAKIEVVRPPLLAKKSVSSQIISMKSAAERFSGSKDRTARSIVASLPRLCMARPSK